MKDLGIAILREVGVPFYVQSCSPIWHPETGTWQGEGKDVFIFVMGQILIADIARLNVECDRRGVQPRYDIGPEQIAVTFSLRIADN